jgi:tetratricopeptide (TPR) repeat protein
VRSRPSRRLTCLVIAVGLALGPAAARDALAQEAVDPRPASALSACAAGDVAKGIAILAQLYAETRNPSFVFNQGRCYQQNGQLDPARQRFQEYLRVGKNEPPEDIRRAEGYLAEIDREIARRQEEEAARAQASYPEAEARRKRTLRVVGLVLGGVAVAAAGVGIFANRKMESLESEINRKAPADGIEPDPAKTNELRELEASGYRYESVQYVSLGLALAAAAGAATTFALGGLGWPGPAPAERAQLAVAPVVSPGLVGGSLQLRF